MVKRPSVDVAKNNTARVKFSTPVIVAGCSTFPPPSPESIWILEVLVSVALEASAVKQLVTQLQRPLVNVQHKDVTELYRYRWDLLHQTVMVGPGWDFQPN